MLGELCDRDRIQKLGEATYIITRWPERVNPGKRNWSGKSDL